MSKRETIRYNTTSKTLVIRDLLAIQGVDQKPRLQKFAALNIAHNKIDSCVYNIHFWIRNDATQNEVETFAIISVKLDTMLGGSAAQQSVLQSHKISKFLLNSKPCIVPFESSVAFGFKTSEEEVFDTRLDVYNRKKIVNLKQVIFARFSLNHDDVSILDVEKKIYQFNGENFNILDRVKALEVIQFLKKKYHA
ncbi:villin-2-like [Hibiscus syriacus]|uniref:villin-2-like n=1 Tax=Hibiscus syriacus TaxID=106335 RepID=UPI001924E107|nr:villin-2-like [Hibiscus syriacus]